ncbi:MAG TPA: gamma-glutamyltransferase [Gemmatimonadales bacterium]|nr:gamma-glutamyltransferase [Gemmatimonadales bacterium]
MHRRLLSAGLILLLAACAGSTNRTATGTVATAGGPQGESTTWPLRGKSRVVEGSHAVVVSGNEIASQVGRDILRAGGNAVDAAVAVGFALTVVHPEAGNIGGGGFMVIRLKDGGVFTLDYREVAPAAATRNMYMDLRGNPTQLSIVGHLAAGVPGSVAGLAEAHRRFGKLPWRDVVQPAVALAENGFVVDSFRYRSIEGSRELLYLFPASRRKFLPDSGHAPQPGTTWRQPDLARTLAAIRDQGRDGFYKGPVSDLIVKEMDLGGGLISHADLENYKALWRDPVRVTYRGYTVYSMPPASSGGVTMGEILNIMEGWPKLPAFGTGELLHRETEAMRRAFTDRNVYLGDPAFVTMPIARLLSKSYAESLHAEIGEQASKTAKFDPSLPRGASTTHYSVVDADGNAVSTTTTLNNSYGSGVTVTGAGFLLNDEMDDFATAPGKPNMFGLVQGEANAVQPGKRMLSAMTPSIVLDPKDQLYLVVGTPGGPRIITMVYHVISNVIDHGMSLPDAVAAPRMHHQALPDVVRLERGGFTPATIADLRARGHVVEEGGYSGDVEAIIRTGDSWEGVSDPRYGGGGAAY